MVVSTHSVWDEVAETFVTEYDDAVVYGGPDPDSVLHEGAARLLANGWVALPSGRLLSPSAVHHVDPRAGD
jgi:hypothetical protein